MVVKPNSKQEKPEMTELAAQIVALGVGIFTMLPDKEPDFYVGFEVDEDSLGCTFFEQHFSKDFNPQEPWTLWTVKREKSFNSIEDGLKGYLVNGTPLIDCIKEVTALPPM